MSQSIEEAGSEDEVVVSAPSLYQQPAYFRQTRKHGKIIKTVEERYLRDDIGFGCYFTDENASKRRKGAEETVGKPRVIETAEQLISLLKPSKPQSLVVCDANVLLHNLDVLEHSKDAMPNIVIPQTALMECRANRMVAYDQTVEMLRSVGGKNQRFSIFFADKHHIETAYVEQPQQLKTDNATGMTPNDENDSRLRNVAAFFGKHLKGSEVRVIFLTDDAASRAFSAKDRQLYQAMTVRSWVKELERNNPGLSLTDLVAQYSNTGSAMPTAQQEHYFQPHLDAKDVSMGIKSGSLYRGVFRRMDEDTSYVTIRKGDERVAVTISGSGDCNRATEGDVVAISLHPIEKWIPLAVQPTLFPKKRQVTGIASETAEPTPSELANVSESFSLDDAAKQLRPAGKVVGIIRRNFSNYSGSIYERASGRIPVTDKEKLACKCEREYPDGSTTCVFFPVDDKIPPILIRTTQRDRFVAQRIVVSIDSWPLNSPFPLGHYVRTLGPSGSKAVETQVLLLQHNIPFEPFPAAVLACLPPSDYKLENDNSQPRMDLRHLPILSIDPPGCTDIDDALHCLKLPNGNFQVGVHIADVTHYVKAGTAIDLEAASRSTSTYLVDRRLDMLPGLLSTDLCSLKGNVDRFAFSVLWEVTPDAQILSVDFQKTIIHSIAALTYREAQTMIDLPGDGSGDPQASAVKGLASLARLFRKRRIDAGALTLASPEVKFVFDSESLNPTDVQSYAMLEANDLVMEFMLLANITVGKKILRHYPTLSVLRRHPAPNRARFDSLIQKAKCRGFEIDISDSKRLADSLDAAEMPSDPYFNKLLRIAATRCMSPAQYFCSGEFRPNEWHHYGLAAPVYTHFTSPIRRYADVVVHRLLAAAIGVAPLPAQLSSKSHLHDLCGNMNRRSRSAQNAGRSSIQLHTLIFFAGDGAKEEDAYVLDVATEEASDPCVTIIVPRFGIEGQVKLPIEKDDEHLHRMPEAHRVDYKKGKVNVSIKVFDKIKIRIWVREFADHQRELVLDLLEPKFTNKVSTS